MSGLRLDLACAGEGGFNLELHTQLPDTGVTAIYGPSGSGKSTLLDCIAGFRQPTKGSRLRFREESWFDQGRSAPAWQRNIAYVFQDARLFPHLNVQQNLEYAAKRATRKNGPSLEDVMHWLDIVKLKQHATASLSGGERQRVAIGRALLSAPQLLLLDEPVANLDQRARRQCLGYLQALVSELAIPTLYVSHDIEEVSQLANYVLLMDEGRAVEQGSLLELCGRLDNRLSQHEQAAAILVCEAGRDDPEFGLTELLVEGQTLQVSQQHQNVGQQYRLRIPAREVSVCRERPKDTSILNILPVELVEIESSTDTRVLLRLSLGSQYLLARITRKSVSQLGLKIGDRLYAQIKSAALMRGAESSDD
ncbi:MAG: molybdenum ABC transporter ATP-binding protein [Pseudomonadota bacterium]